MDILIIGLLLVSFGLNIYQLTGQQRLRGVLRAGLHKAERDRTKWVRIPYNQLAELMGWEPEFTSYTYSNRKTGHKPVTAEFQSSVYPIKETP